MYPQLLTELAEECREASSHSQLMVSTHSLFFVNGLEPRELWVLYRDIHGYTQVKRAADMQGIIQFIKEGALLGNLWMGGFFKDGATINQGSSTQIGASKQTS